MSQRLLSCSGRDFFFFFSNGGMFSITAVVTVQLCVSDTQQV